MVGSQSQPGIMIRALNDLFQEVKDKQDEYSVRLFRFPFRSPFELKLYRFAGDHVVFGTL